MVQFILGKSGSGKTTEIHNIIKKCCEDKQVILFVPEQFTYETERLLFKLLGANLFKNLQVTSFSRFSKEVFKLYGGVSGEYATESAKVALMELTVANLAENLDIYKKSARSKSFSTTMLNTITELKNAGVSDTDFFSALQSIDQDSYLYKKTNELATIYSAYSARLYTTYKDPLDDITRATKKLQGRKYFEDFTVFFDEFKGFTANENDIIKLIFSTARETYVSLCVDSLRLNKSELSPFASVGETLQKLMRFCREQSVAIKPHISLDTEYRFNSPMLTHFEENLFSLVVKPFEGENDGSITAMLCTDSYDEVEYTLSTITHLVQAENYSYNDVVIIARSLEPYMSKLIIGCDKYKIPFYADNRSGVQTKPLIRFIRLCFECVLNGYQSDDIQALLKCGLVDFPQNDIAELENYTFVWDTKKAGWFEPFVQSPQGFTDRDLSRSDSETLNRINAIREPVITALSSFEQGIKQGGSNAVAVAILKLISDFNLKSRTERVIAKLSQSGELDLAQQQKRVWEILIEIIDTLAIVTADEKVDAKGFYKIYNLICDTYDMGTLPQSLDCVLIGAADRIRVSDKKAVFVLGANEDVFPLNPTVTGVFTEKERELLISLELQISPPIKDRILEERFIAYKTLTAMANKLYITASKSTVEGKPLAQSTILNQLTRMFGEEIIGDTELLGGEYFCKSKSSAFSHLAKTFYDNTPLTATLKSLLSEDELYNRKIKKISTITQNREHVISDLNVAKDIFKQEMNLSPTKIEGYHQCAFKYFCEHGLKIRSLRKAELNPLETGSLIHKILENVTKAVDLKNNYDEVSIKKLIKSELDEYIEKVMGGAKDKTSRFIYLYNRLRQSIFKIVEHLHSELSQSAFTPIEYEFEISSNSDVKPLKLVTEDGAAIIVSGKIDRIDSYVNKNGQKYIRIVDYKSGKKVFSLDDVYNGLNLQMLIYLFCIQNNGTGVYENTIPAGVLYMPASEVEPALERGATAKEVSDLKLKHYRMNGLILNNPEVITAMDNSESGVYIPISYNKDGTASKKSCDSLATLQELSKIDKYIKSLIERMATSLHNGKIPAYPVEKVCEYCDYSAVCGRGGGINSKKCDKLPREVVIKQMEATSKQDTDNNGGEQLCLK